ncbi:glucose-1-phosphate thymidylyltransferase [Sphingobacteriaceae bacterium]|nr:glucose-1-phosphate thymidylyltransferase [Sphingobacteriaceae bacterium]
MDFVLRDDFENWKGFLPLTFTRPIAELRIGILTLKEKWDKHLNTVCTYQTQPYLSKKFPGISSQAIYISSHYCPDKNLAEAIKGLKQNEALYKDQELVAFYGDFKDLEKVSAFKKIDYPAPIFFIKNLWDIFQKNGEALKADFDFLTKGRTSNPLSESVTVIGDRNLIFLEEGAKIEACILNTSSGPIYLGHDSEMMEGSVIRGPFALCEHAVVKLSTKVYGATTVGPHSRIGGEVSNSVIIGYSNKGHDGFLGNSVLGEWCNLGADTNNSNLKNNYGNVKLYSYAKQKQIDTGLQFCGLIMGDHSKSGINTMFNTGTVVGVGSNIYGGGFPPTHVPDFSWGGSEGFESYKLEKLFETAERVYERRGLTFSDTEKEILSYVNEGKLKL